MRSLRYTLTHARGDRELVPGPASRRACSSLTEALPTTDGQRWFNKFGRWSKNSTASMTSPFLTSGEDCASYRTWWSFGKVGTVDYTTDSGTRRERTARRGMSKGSIRDYRPSSPARTHLCVLLVVYRLEVAPVCNSHPMVFPYRGFPFAPFQITVSSFPGGTGWRADKSDTPSV